MFSHLGRGTTVLVLTAHPDDEVFAHGAAIATLSAQGSRVALRTASGGEGAEPAMDSIGVYEARRRRAIRLQASCDRLGVDNWDWIAEGRWIDTGGRPGPGSLSTASVVELADAVTRHIQKTAPDVILTVGPDGLTGHPDHILMHRAANQAGASYGIPVFGSYLEPDDIARGRRLLADVLPGERVGSGRMVGRTELQPLTLTAPRHAADARGTALDQYANGLGSMPLSDLVRVHSGRGDSLLFRSVLDAIGWHVERYALATN